MTCLHLIRDFVGPSLVEGRLGAGAPTSGGPTGLRLYAPNRRCTPQHSYDDLMMSGDFQKRMMIL
jgi:hypothetical protein